MYQEERRKIAHALDRAVTAQAIALDLLLEHEHPTKTQPLAAWAKPFRLNTAPYGLRLQMEHWYNERAAEFRTLLDQNRHSNPTPAPTRKTAATPQVWTSIKDKQPIVGPPAPTIYLGRLQDVQRRGARLGNIISIDACDPLTGRQPDGMAGYGPYDMPQLDMSTDQRADLATLSRRDHAHALKSVFRPLVAQHGRELRNLAEGMLHQTGACFITSEYSVAEQTTMTESDSDHGTTRQYRTETVRTFSRLTLLAKVFRLAGYRVVDVIPPHTHVLAPYYEDEHSTVKCAEDPTDPGPARNMLDAEIPAPQPEATWAGPRLFPEHVHPAGLSIHQVEQWLKAARAAVDARGAARLPYQRSQESSKKQYIKPSHKAPRRHGSPPPAPVAADVKAKIAARTVGIGKYRPGYSKPQTHAADTALTLAASLTPEQNAQWTKRHGSPYDSPRIIPLAAK